jgi:lysozyme
MSHPPFDESEHALPHGTEAMEDAAHGEVPDAGDPLMPTIETGLEPEPEPVPPPPTHEEVMAARLASQPKPLRMPAAPQGIDLYHGDGPCDYAELRQGGKSFAIRKATQGTDIADPGFAHDWAAMRAAGLVRGATHFWRPSQDPVAQAEFFLATVHAACEAIGETLEDAAPLLCLDVEAQPEKRPALDGKTPEECAEWVRAFVSHVAERTRFFCVIYTSAQFMADHMHGVELGVANLGGPGHGCQLWAVKHGKGAEPECPPEYGPGNWLISQYAFDARDVHGAHQCDLDTWHTVKLGDHGPLVTSLQTYLGMNPTGVFDAATDATVKRFQTAHGLVPDGRVGPLTGSRALWA